MKKRGLQAALLLLLVLLGAPCAAEAAHPTVYKGVDYKRVYDYDYFVKKYPSIKKKFGGNDKKILEYFVKTGMKRQMRGSKRFDVKSYRYANARLRRKYVYNYARYYRHYMKTGYKYKNSRASATGVKKMQNPVTVYNGRDYSAEYDYFYYLKHNPDVKERVGDDDLLVLKHYVTVGKKAGKKAKAGSSSEASWDDGKIKITITSCKITGSGRNVTVKARTSGSSGIPVGLFAQEPYIVGIDGLKPSATGKTGSTMTLTMPLNRSATSSALQKKFYLAVQSRNGSWRICSNFYYIQNPSAAAKVKKAFPKPARGTKKGLKMQLLDSHISKAIELKCSHVLIDFPIETFLGGYGVTYQYEGKNYHFSSEILNAKSRLKKLKSAGIVTTGVFYLSNAGMTRYMMPKAASGSKSGAVIFGINTKNQYRKELEALFSCLAEQFTSDGVLLANWIFGNESNQYICYNYCGNISYGQYIKDFTEQFRLFNTAVKSVWSNARTYICFDHNWNLSFKLSGSYNAKRMLASIDDYLEKHGDVHYDLSLHPYPSPELDTRFWNRSSWVTDSGSTQQYTMLNIGSICKYVKNKYGSDIRIILPEVGLSSVYRGSNMENAQAAAVAYAYYLAEFNPDIDMIGIHREKDEPGEVAGGFVLGLYRGSFGSPKPSASVFRYMDTKSYKKYTQPYLKYINNAGSWTSLVKNFNPGRFR